MSIVFKIIIIAYGYQIYLMVISAFSRGGGLDDTTTYLLSITPIYYAIVKIIVYGYKSLL